MKEPDLETVVKDPRLTAKAVGASTNVFMLSASAGLDEIFDPITS